MIERFAALFRGGGDVHGQVIPDGTAKGRASTVKMPAQLGDYRDHLSGKVGLGVVPVDHRGLCWFGAVDVDAHDDGHEVDHLKLEALLRGLKHPVLVTQTRRKGAHVYVFGKEPLPAADLRTYLGKLAVIVKGFGNPIEVFPKQGHLDANNKGTWINLPYFDAENGHRYCIHDAQPQSLEEFLDLAEARALTVDELRGFAGHVVEELDFTDAPPCIIRLREEGNVDIGARNNALYNYGVMLLKMGKDRDGIYEHLQEFNRMVMSGEATAKTLKEMAQRITAAGTYNYLCQEEPICSRCDKTTCNTRKFGWKTAYTREDGAVALRSVFTKLTIVESEPPTYYLHVNNRRVQMEAEELLNYRNVRIRVMQQADFQVPPLKSNAWEAVFQSLFHDRELLPAPATANEDMAVLATLFDWCKNAETVDYDQKPRISVPDDLIKGRPIVMVDPDSGALRTYFRAQDLERELKRRKISGYTGRELWAVMQKQRCTYETLANGMESWSKPFVPNGTTLEAPVPEERF
ncbi:MAG: hypothetical protein JSS77_15910 [Acidobacteria bacterium]|nr:hypothetical protein [Acidobacteriota bacterium]